VLTNSPFFNWQLKNMKQYDGLGGDKPLPGTNESPDRFVRAVYHGMHLPTASTPKESVAGILSVLHNVSAPFTPVPSHSSLVHRTIWRTVADLTHHVYYFNSTQNFTMVYAQLDKFNLQPGSPVMKLDLVKRHDLSGDMSSEFESVK
jgi:penicillin V acylase-like amidase (Ntn superfamily)